MPAPDPYAATAIRDPYAATAIGAPAAGAGPLGTPQPNAHPAVSMTAASPTAVSRLLGSGSVSDAAGVVGTHLKNMVAAPYHALVDGPKTAQETAEMGTAPDSGYVARGLGHVGLAAARMLVNPTLNSGKAAVSALKSGDLSSAANNAMDAVPIAGPWARSVETDAQTHGALPALAGLGTDIVAPGLASKGIGVVAKPLASSAAIGDVTRMIKPSVNDVAFSKSPAEGLLSQPGGVFSLSKEALLDKSKANLASLGADIGNKIRLAPQTNASDVSGAITQPFDESLNFAGRTNQSALFNRLQEAKAGLTSDTYYDPQTESIQQKIGPKNLTALTPNDLFAIKKDVGDSMKWTNQAFDDDVNATRGKVYGGLKNALNTAVPDLAPLNEQYANLRSGVNALERRLPVEARNNAISLPDALIGGSAAIGGSPLAGVATIAGRKLLSGAPLRTAVDAGLWRYGTTPTATLTPSIPGLVLRAASQKRDAQ